MYLLPAKYTERFQLVLFTRHLFLGYGLSQVVSNRRQLDARLDTSTGHFTCQR